MIADRHFPAGRRPWTLPSGQNTPEAIAVDGTSPGGTFARTGGAGVHLLSALTHQSGVVLGRQDVTVGTSEIAWMQPLLDQIDLAWGGGDRRRPACHPRSGRLPRRPWRALRVRATHHRSLARPRCARLTP